MSLKSKNITVLGEKSLPPNSFKKRVADYINLDNILFSRLSAIAVEMFSGKYLESQNLSLLNEKSYFIYPIYKSVF
ncbi:MAG: hypothetical protein M3033_17765 [Acidobacteriota bacterium]|nr:hypothetical protein [Acidobacteriota bacterium]